MIQPKYWLFAIIAILFLLIISLYVFLPSTSHISRVQPIRSPGTALNRFFTEKDSLTKFWNSVSGVHCLDKGKGDSTYSYKDLLFTCSIRVHPYENIGMRLNNHQIQSTLVIVPVGNDSSTVFWNTGFPNSLIPWTRLKEYNQAVHLSELMDSLLVQLRNFLEIDRNIYGIHIEKTVLKHNIFISSQLYLDHSPSLSEIYQNIALLKRRAKNQGASLLDSPMLHIELDPNKKFQMMVGIPINKEIPDGEQVYLKNMPEHGKILITKVVGGKSLVDESFKKMELYMSDHQTGNPALPFQVLETNRLQEPDSNKWVTYLYYPIIN